MLLTISVYLLLWNVYSSLLPNLIGLIFLLLISKGSLYIHLFLHSYLACEHHVLKKPLLLYWLGTLVKKSTDAVSLGLFLELIFLFHWFICLSNASTPLFACSRFSVSPEVRKCKSSNFAFFPTMIVCFGHSKTFAFHIHFRTNLFGFD